MLTVALRPEWAAFEARFEIWQGRDLFCFDLAGRALQPYERSGLFYAAVPRTAEFTKPCRVVLANQTVAAFDSYDNIGMRLYLHLPTDENNDEKIPEHVATVHLSGLKNLCAHSDATWVSPVPIYGTARFSFVQTPEPDWFGDMLTVFDLQNMPDLRWLARQKKHPSIERVFATPPYEAVPGAPLCEHFLNKNWPPMFAEYAGASAASVWRLGRGNGARAAAPEFFELRVREALALRGPKSNETWASEIGTVYSLDVEAQFCDIVRALIVADDPPRGRHRLSTEMHNWAREAIESVVYALGAHCVTRRYVFDHRWLVDNGSLKYERRTDDNTLSFEKVGDCEDSNSVVYFLALQLLREEFKENSLLWCVKACIVAAGVPVCVSGSSQVPSDSRDGSDASASHLFGLFIPQRIFARLVWGSDRDVTAELRRAMGVSRGFSAIARTAAPHVVETICWTTTDYLSLTRWPCTEHRAFFDAYRAVMRAENEDLVFPQTMGANWPLASDDNGFVVHGRMINLFTAAVPLLFSNEWRAQPSLEIDPEGFARPATADLLLKHTMRFIACARGEIGVPTVELFRNADFRLVSATRVTHQLHAADERLARCDRPFVPLLPVQPAWLSQLRALLPGERADVPTEDYRRFTVFVYGDRLERGAALVRKLLQKFGRRCLGFALRPYCWAVAVVFHLDVHIS